MADLQQPSDDDLNESGVPRTMIVRKPRSVGGLFADGATILNANTYTQVLGIAGSPGQRVRGKFTCGGTLSFAYRRPPPHVEVAYDASVDPPHGDVTVTANTEFDADIAPIGEALLAIKFDPSADGIVNFLDILPSTVAPV